MKILFISKWSDACSYYRMISPSKFLNREEGIEVRNSYLQAIPNDPDSGIKEKDVEWADIVVFQRPITSQDEFIISQIKRLRASKVVLGEYDDDYSCIPWWNPGYTFLKANEDKWPNSLKHYDGITVSTENLSESLKRTAKEQRTTADVRVIKNAIDFEIFDRDFKPVLDHPICKPVLNETIDKNGNSDVVINQEKWGTSEQFQDFCNDKIVIAWFGSRTHFFDLDWIVEDLGRVCERHKDVVVLFLGYLNFRAVTEIDYDQIFMTTGASPTSRYYHLLQTLPIDISLCPVDPNEFNKSKSAIKYHESCAAGFLPICSEFDTYEMDFNAGLLADYRHGSWEAKIEQAIELVRSQKYLDIVHSNRAFVRERHDVKNRVPEYLEYYRNRINFVRNGRD